MKIKFNLDIKEFKKLFNRGINIIKSFSEEREEIILNLY